MYLPSWLFSCASSHLPTTLMMARPASRAQIIIAGALGSGSSASAGRRAPSYSVGGLITALDYHQQSLHNSSRSRSGRVTTVKVFHKLKESRMLIYHRSETQSAWVHGGTLLNSSAAFGTRLYIVAKTKKRGAGRRRQQQQTAISLALSDVMRIWRTLARGNAENMRVAPIILRQRDVLRSIEPSRIWFSVDRMSRFQSEHCDVRKVAICWSLFAVT